VQNRKRLLLIGFGSIGLTHVKKASNFFNEVTVIDLNENKEQELLLLSKLLTIDVKFFNSIDELASDEKFDLIVIANWGPDHMQTFKKVSMLSSNILIEKPLVSRLSDLLVLKEQSTKGKIIIANHQWNYSGFKDKVKELQNQYTLGKINGAQVLGGAKCLVTNGIHYLALTSHLLEQFPKTVIGVSSSHNINPRRSDFVYYEGVSAWQYEGGQYLSIHFQNSSHVSETFRILFEHGIIEVKKGKMRAHTIGNQERDSISKPARTLHPTVKSQFVDAFTNENDTDGLDKLYKGFIEKTYIVEDFEPGYQASLGILASLFSSMKGSQVKISNLEQADEDEASIEWNIT
jgi:predicted dehydrogenase